MEQTHGTASGAAAAPPRPAHTAAVLTALLAAATPACDASSPAPVHADGAADLSAPADAPPPRDAAAADAGPEDAPTNPDQSRPDSAQPDLFPPWPAGFAPQPVNAPSGALCAIPADYVQTGGDPVNPPCQLEHEHFAPPALGPMPSGLRVVTWNVEFGKHSAEVQQALLSQPELMGADLILLQEVPRHDAASDPPQINLARQLAQALHLDYLFAVEWDFRLVPENGGEHGLAILSRYPLGNASLLRHTPLHDYYASHQRFGGRATLGADIVVGGKRLRVFNAHLGHRDPTGNGRAQQGSELLAEAALAVHPPAQLLGGDLNTFLCNPLLMECTGGPLAEQVIKDILAAGWLDLTPGFNSWTEMGAGFFPQRLDWLFARQLTPLSHAVLQSVGASDHVPLVAVCSPP